MYVCGRRATYSLTHIHGLRTPCTPEIHSADQRQPHVYYIHIHTHTHEEHRDENHLFTYKHTYTELEQAALKIQKVQRGRIIRKMKNDDKKVKSALMLQVLAHYSCVNVCTYVCEKIQKSTARKNHKENEKWWQESEKCSDAAGTCTLFVCECACMYVGSALMLQVLAQ